MSANILKNMLENSDRSFHQLTNVFEELDNYLKMSSNTVQPFYDNRKDLFNHRVCDDLCEFILQFLPIEDKFRLECVSKQFQRTVFQLHHKLIIDRKLLKVSRREPKYFETILKKLPNLRAIEENLTESDLILNDSLINLIIKCCNKLVAINCNLQQMCDNTRHLFVQKYGSKLHSIDANIVDIEMIRNSFPNIRQINCLFSRQIVDRYSMNTILKNYISIKRINECELRNLRKVSLVMSPHTQRERTDFKSFVENYINLSHLCIAFNSSYNDFTRYQLFDFNTISVFKEISNFNHLIHLEIIAEDQISDNSLANGLELLALNCNKLKSLKVYNICADKSENTEFVNKFNNLVKFTELQTLDLQLIGFNDFYTTLYFNQIEEQLNQSLKGLPNLTHLAIKFPKRYGIRDNLLNNIDVYLPKLKFLFIRNGIIGKEETAHTLSRLSFLESIDLHFTTKSMVRIVKTEINKNCPKIKYMRIY